MAAAKNHPRYSAEVKEEQVERITRWLLTPEAYRRPRSNRELAREIGLSPAYTLKLTRTIQDGLGDVLLDGEKFALANYKSVVRKVTEAALQGDEKALKLYFEYIVKPRRDQKRDMKRENSQLITAALKLLPENRKLAAPKPDVAVIDAIEVKSQ